MENSIKNLKRALKYAKDLGFNESDFYCIHVWDNEITMQGYRTMELINIIPKPYAIDTNGYINHKFDLNNSLQIGIILT